MPRYIEENWVDIVPPELPATAPDPVLYLGSFIALVLLLAFGIYLQRRPRQRSRRALRRLSRDLRRARLEPKRACFEIRRWLRTGFGYRRLQSVPLAHSLQADWQAYLDRLGHYCFSGEAPSVAELDGIIREARVWLDARVVAA
jgi:hypothetical protein